MVASLGSNFWVGYYVCILSIQKGLEVEDLSEEGRPIMLNWTLGFEGEDEKKNIGLCRFAFSAGDWWNE